MTSCFRKLAFSLLATVAPLARGGAAADGAISVELNKVEQAGDDCRVYLVMNNALAATLSAIKLDLVLFDTDGIIAHRFALNVAPLAAGKTSVKSFDVPDMSCETLGRVLLNDAIDCRGASGPITQCVGEVVVSSLGEVEFFR